VTAGASGRVFIADSFWNRILKVGTNGIITTVAGTNSSGYTGDGGAAIIARLNSPSDVAVDVAGNLFIVDHGNNVIRKVSTNGIITTVAGTNNSFGYSGDGGVATNASLDWPTMVAVNAVGNLFIADSGNNVIRKVDTNGIITTVAGDQSTGGSFGGDGDVATNASFNYPYGVALDPSGNLFIADANNNRIREVLLYAGYPTIILNNATTQIAGDYSVVIANAFGSVTSSVVTLTVTPLVESIQISKVVRSGTNIVITWGSVSGATYNVLRTNVLKAPTANWPALTNGYSGSGSSLSYTDTTAAATMNFYRVSSP